MKLTQAQRTTLGNIIAKGGVADFDLHMGRMSAGDVRRSVVNKLVAMGLVSVEPAWTDVHYGRTRLLPAETLHQRINHYYATAAGVRAYGPEVARAHTRVKKTSKTAPYTSESLAVSRRMIAPGPLHEEQAIIYDLMTRYRHLQSTLAYYDRGTGKPIAAEAEKLRQQAWDRIEQLPEGELRTNLTRQMYER
jgi:hypothetical protein